MYVVPLRVTNKASVSTGAPPISKRSSLAVASIPPEIAAEGIFIAPSARPKQETFLVFQSFISTGSVISIPGEATILNEVDASSHPFIFRVVETVIVNIVVSVQAASLG